jgi:membrane protease YdiL (CAAX protease family)
MVGDAPSHSLAVRQVAAFLVVTLGLALAIALALPNAGIAPLISIVFPTIAVVVALTLVTPRGQRRAAWAGIGFGPSSWRGLVVAVLGPVIITGLSFAMADALGVVRFPNLDFSVTSIGGVVGKLTLTTAVFGVIFLGEEIGWRGYLLPRLAELMSGRRAAVVTGAFHAVFHLPLLTLTTTYQGAGSRWIVVPTVMVTLTLAGVWYAWLRLSTGSIWAVSLSHSAFNNVMETATGAAVPTSAAAMAYTTTETGVVTLLIMVLVSGWLLIRRSDVFERAAPTALRDR